MIIACDKWNDGTNSHLSLWSSLCLYWLCSISRSVFSFVFRLNDLWTLLFPLLFLRAGLEIGGLSLDGSVRDLEMGLSLNKISLNISFLVLCGAESLSRVQLFATPWTIVRQAPLSMGILQARILEWVAMPSSTGSPQPRDQTQVSCLADGFFTCWAIREAPVSSYRGGNGVIVKIGDSKFSRFT